MIKSAHFLLVFLALALQMGCTSYRLVGNVVDLELNPVPGARVTLHYPSSGDSLSVVTAADGSYSLDGIEEQNVSVEVRAQHYQPQRRDLTINKEVQSEQLQIQHSPTRISGQVLDSKTKEPLQSVVIRILPNMISILTDIDGRFLLDNGIDPELPATLQFTRSNYNVYTKIVQPRQYQLVDIGQVYMTTILDPKMDATGKLRELQAGDIDNSLYSRNIPVDQSIEAFLRDSDKFSRDEFGAKLRETSRTISDETITKNLEELVKSGKIILDPETNLYRPVKTN